MEEKLKYRLVGAAVILALMAFFLPLILDSKKYKTEIVTQIPPMPTSSIDSDSATEQSNDSRPKESETIEKPLVINLDTPIEDQATDEAIVSEDVVDGIQESSLVKIDEELSEINDKATVENSSSTEEVKTPNKVAKTQQEKIIEAVEAPKVEVETKAKEAENKVEVVNTTAKPDFKESAYVIQIGSFSNKENATQLVNDLRKQDYRAYQRVSDKFSRVFVGPYPEVSIAKSRSSKLAEIVGNSVKVIEFDPIKH